MSGIRRAGAGLNHWDVKGRHLIGSTSGAAFNPRGFFSVAPPMWEVVLGTRLGWIQLKLATLFMMHSSDLDTVVKMRSVQVSMRWLDLWLQIS